MLSEQDHQLISACLDGELDAEQDLAFKRRLLQEPELNQQYQSFKAMGVDLKSAFGDIANDPVPDEISALLADTGEDKIYPQTADNSNWRFLALAASVAMIGLLSFFGFQSTSTDEASLALNSALNNALNTQPSMEMSQLDEKSQFIALQSFRHINGRICREYLIKGEKRQSHGVACKKSGRWQVEIKKHTQPKPQKAQHYVTASGPQEAAIEQYLHSALNGSPLNAETELQMIKQNWQK